LIWINALTDMLWETEGVKARASTVRMVVNGSTVEVAVEPQETLLEVLRDRLDLIGTKQGCGEGTCGACTVQVNDQPVLSCMSLAVQAEGKEVRTVEGLIGPQPHPLVGAFERHNAAQCGFCTPGLLMSAESLLRTSGRVVSRTEAAEALSGNLCRCTGYTKVLDAVVDASRVLHGEDADDGR
jgi:aerobic-type carbon monoxide dehydrogenase small subunit (CoxS/CutS family)